MQKADGNMMGQFLICGFLGFVVSFGVILMTLRLERHFKSKFTGGRDEFHHADQAPVSRLGGIGLAAAFASVAILSLTVFGRPFTLEIAGVIGTALAMFGLGLWDDLRALGARRKLFGQLTIATAAYFLGISISHFKIPLTSHIIDLGFWSWPVTIFWIVAMTNLINLIDGVDGLAGGISLMLMLLMSVVGGNTGCVSLEAAGMAGALLAFLRFNFPPAKIYMGDGGAYFLGCLIGLLTIRSSQKGTVVAALIAPLFVLALPILDTSLAILRRGLRGLPLFRADRRHIHHRLLESGLSRRNVVWGVYAFTAFFLGLGFIAFWGRGQYLPLILGSGILAVLLVAGRLNFSREWFAVGRVLGNSMNRRAEIQYALAQTRWLAMEGARCQTIGDLCEDTVFIARKLGYDWVHIRLEDDERTWRIRPVNGNELHLFRHKLSGHRYCFIELGVAGPKVKGDTEFLRAKARQKSCGSCLKTENVTLPAGTGAFVFKDYSLLSELLAEGWAKAIAAWEKQNQLPVRFDGCLTPPPEKQPEKIPALQTATA
jgi:UDP-GlcNAc:undecaprenyl-phosphate GlcNAc-1-phosphate transferase